MYLRAVHTEPNIPVLQEFIRENPLGILTTAIKSSEHPFIQSSHIPFVLDVSEYGEDKGSLRGHIARQNPQAKAMITALEERRTEAQLPEEVLVLFTAAPNHYVTPKFYITTKPATGKVVPTWNYSAVQAYGKATIYYDSTSTTDAFLEKQLHDLSQQAEINLMGYVAPWKVTDAPKPYIEIMKKNIIGIEIKIERLESKFKMSQELGAGDRRGVIEGLNNLGTEVGAAVAQKVKEAGDLKDLSK
jgi:transcriptional regulator